MRETLRFARPTALGLRRVGRGSNCLPVVSRLTTLLEPLLSGAGRNRLAQIHGTAGVLPQHRDQPLRLAGDLVDDGPEIRLAHHDIVEPHLPDRCGAGIDQRGGRVSQQLVELQSGRRRHHQLAISCQQVLALEALDDLGARGRCTDALRFLEPVAQSLVLDEAPGVLHGVDQRASTCHTMVNEQVTRFFTGYRRDAHPMAVMVGTVGALSAFYHNSTDISDPRQREIASHRMIAKMPTIAAMAYKYSMGQPFIYPRNDLDYTSNFLQMCFAVPCEPYIVNPVISRALDRIFILHADHEQNASTSTVRLAGSSGANPFACISSGIACLWGPAHGGANEAALNMLQEIGTVDRIPEFIKKAKDKNVRLPPDGLWPSRVQEL